MKSYRVITLVLVVVQVFVIPIVAETKDGTNAPNIFDEETTRLANDYPYVYDTDKKCSRGFCEAYWSTNGSNCVSDSNWGVNYDIKDQYDCSLDIGVYGLPVHCSEPCQPEAAEKSEAVRIGFVFIACWLCIFFSVIGFVFYMQHSGASNDPTKNEEVKAEKPILKHCDTIHTEMTANDDHSRQDAQYQEHSNQAKDINTESQKVFCDEETGNPMEVDINKALPGDFIFQMH
mmetsp:Transcript_16018/g.24949  ORF Transcript_16018/g.24949 Transcript_16018/m.24949 type:complete len:232 (+) Transcript_16018:3-698(+)